MFCCQVPSVAVRSEFSHGSEQISQVLLGETVQCLDFHENWVRIRCAWDQYTGWVPSKALREIPDIEEKGLSVLSDYAFVTDHSTNSNLLLSMCSILAPALFPNGYSVIRGDIGQIPINSSEVSDTLIWTIGKDWIGTPYHWGGRSRFGVDCSGFVQMVMARIGVPIPRDSRDQLAQAPQKVPIQYQESLKSGQLAFFGPKPTQINHVGLVLSNDRILHASGQVRLDHLSTQGIHKILPYQTDYIGPTTHTLQALATYFDSSQ